MAAFLSPERGWHTLGLPMALRQARSRGFSYSWEYPESLSESSKRHSSLFPNLDALREKQSVADGSQDTMLIAEDE